MRLTEASHRYLTVRQRDGYSAYTLTAYRFQHHALIRDLGDPDVRRLTLDDLARDALIEQDAEAIHASVSNHHD